MHRDRELQGDRRHRRVSGSASEFDREAAIDVISRGLDVAFIADSIPAKVRQSVFLSGFQVENRK
jgi:hypothetical protein